MTDTRRLLPQPPEWESIEPLTERRDENSWLIVYMDVFTLMLSIFVMLLAYATYSPDDFDKVTKAMVQTVAVQGEVKSEVKPVEQRQQSEAAIERPAKLEARELEQEFKLALQAQGLEESVDVVTQSNRINLQIQDEILFATGKADLAQSGRRVLTGLVPLLSSSEHQISVEGHTDPVPIVNAEFPSNWELSTARSTRVLRFLISQGVPEERLRAIGYAATRPIAENESAEGRARNRRVALVVHMEESR